MLKTIKLVKWEGSLYRALINGRHDVRKCLIKQKLSGTNLFLLSKLVDFRFVVVQLLSDGLLLLNEPLFVYHSLK